MKSSDRMQAVMQVLEQTFPGCAIVLLVAPFDAPTENRVNYIGNGNREDIKTMMKEVIARWEGRGHDALGAKQ